MKSTETSLYLDTDARLKRFLFVPKFVFGFFHRQFFFCSPPKC